MNSHFSRWYKPTVCARFFTPSLVILLTIAALAGWVPTANAYQFYSNATNDQGGCGQCHTGFRDNTDYISNAEATAWGLSLHNAHLDNTDIETSCDNCHGGSTPPGSPARKVNLSNSGNAKDGVNAISCSGCHGRFEDANSVAPVASGFDGTNSPGWGAGLRQQHFVANTTLKNLDATTISFTSPDTIADSASGFGIFDIGDRLQIDGAGAGTNAGNFVTVLTVDDTTITTEEMIIDTQAAGAQVILSQNTQGCASCHGDSNPANFTPAGEDTEPPWYSDTLNTSLEPDDFLNSCNPNGEEVLAGLAIGLDNDGDVLDDGADTDCIGDSDGDGVLDPNDNCPDDFNPGQEDFDGDGVGYVCDTTCPADIDFTHIFMSGDVFEILASSSVIYEGTMQSGSDIIFGAPTGELKPGTSIKTGATFLFMLPGCDP